MKVYVYGLSKAQINRRLECNEDIIGTEYNAFNPRGYMTKYFVSDLEDQTIIAVYKELIDGQPKAHVWGTYLADKNRVK